MAVSFSRYLRQQAAFQPESDPLTELKQQVASLQSQLTTLMSKKAKKSPKTKETLSINQVIDDVPANESSLPDVAPVNRVAQNPNTPGNELVEIEDLPGSESVERETNLSDNGNLVKGLDEDCPEQLPVPSDMPECDETNVLENEGEEEINETEEQADTSNLVRRSMRNNQPPRRLDYTELGTPLVTVVKSFFQGLTTVWNDLISENDASACPPVLPPLVITV
ncbi:hypothetical protein HF521_020345 [Silurus meridionalis]|uniref:Uncharacterized protein n=1 Tax=Silurus meridionalis TaxID=175797 RepID=A0A8T0BDQ8_SILME|nr:hypothetical protein HF521_020345 [Silurus meridionalis]